MDWEKKAVRSAKYSEKGAERQCQVRGSKYKVLGEGHRRDGLVRVNSLRIHPNGDEWHREWANGREP